MLKPAKMKRVMIAGSKDWLEPVVERLFDTELLHVIEFSETNDFKIGSSMEKSGELSSKIIKVRNMIKALNVSETEGQVSLRETRSYINQGIEELEKKIHEIEKRKEKTEEEMKEHETGIKAIEDIENIPLRFEDYRGYKSVSVIAGKVKVPISFDFPHELYEDREKGVIVLFVQKDMEAEANSKLSSILTPISIPNLQGDVKAHITFLREKRATAEKELIKISMEMEELRKKQARALLACQEELEISIKKAELPLRLATTKNSFIVQGWVPETDFTKLQLEIEKLAKGSVHTEAIEEHNVHEIEAPIKLENPAKVSPFEGLLKMYSLPKYEEIDPTAILFITYPMFFGLMVGDLMYGLGFILLGLFLKKRSVMGVKGKDIAPILIMAGIWSSLFGLFFFGEFMGIHFTPPVHEALPVGGEEIAIPEEQEGGELYWSNMLGINIPHNIGPVPLGIFSKFRDLSVLMRLSLIIGLIHIVLGLLLGYVNEKNHDFKKALYGKIGWIVFLIGFFTLMFSPQVESTLTFMKKVFIVEIVLPEAAFYIGAFITLVSIVMLYKAEGINAVMEIPVIFSNMLSYTRLTAVGLSKAGVALAVNTIGFKMLIFNGKIIEGFLVLLPFHLLIFILGIIAAGLHSLRLQYVEFFTKFYQGGGKPFDPLKEARKYTVS